MKKYIYFDRFKGDFWPSIKELEPYFLAAEGQEWFDSGGNDTAGIDLIGIDGTEELSFGHGQKKIGLSLWGKPGLGVLILYEKTGAADFKDAYTSKGDITRLGELVRSMHATPLPVGLFIPFAEAWKAVKEFMETEGQLPTSIEWVRNADLPPNTFPDP